MSESKMSKRDWRVDQVNETTSEPEPESLAPSSSPAAAACPWTRQAGLWSKLAARWVRVRAGRCLGFSAVCREEEVIHELGRVLEECESPERIERSFIESVARLTAARSVQWVLGPAEIPCDGEGDGRLEIPLRGGSVAFGRLVVLPTLEQTGTWSADTVARLRTLSTMAAFALLRHNLQNVELTHPENEQHGSISKAQEISVARNGHHLGNLTDKTNTAVATVFQDATFLHAVLPFALGLSRRHGESMSLLCVSVDRLNAIHELLGRAWADRVVRSIGAHIAGMIRDSDIVARLDDDRIIVVLPRAMIDDAWKIAHKICQSVEWTPDLLAELPDLTVSIGVAEFPACAENVYELLDAADHALSKARSQGRNQAVAAGTRNQTDPVNGARCAS